MVRDSHQREFCNTIVRTTDSSQTLRHVRDVPTPDIAASFDHLIGAAEQRRSRTPSGPAVSTDCINRPDRRLHPTNATASI
jgi:hypothetical protein